MNVKHTLAVALVLGILSTAAVQPAAACAGEDCPWYRYVELAENTAELAVYIICKAENLGETVQACFNYWYDYLQNFPAVVLLIVQGLVEDAIRIYCNTLGDPNRYPCN